MHMSEQTMNCYAVTETKELFSAIKIAQKLCTRIYQDKIEGES